MTTFVETDNMETSKKGIDLIKKWESCKLEAYLCPNDIPTIGYGHTEGVKMGLEITQEEADILLKQDLFVFEMQLNDLPEFFVRYRDQCEFDASISLIYNIGIGNFKRSKTFKAMKAGDETEMIIQWLDFNKSGGKYYKGLYNRRADEIRLYFSE